MLLRSITRTATATAMPPPPPSKDAPPLSGAAVAAVAPSPHLNGISEVLNNTSTSNNISKDTPCSSEELSKEPGQYFIRTCHPKLRRL